MKRLMLAALVLVFAGITALAVENYTDVRIHESQDPTQGDELRVNYVPIVPLGAYNYIFTGGIQTGSVEVIALGRIPNDAIFIGAIVDLDTAFDSAAVITVGSSADFDAYVVAGDVTEQTPGQYLVFDTSAALTDDTTFYLFIDNTAGTATETGALKITLLFAAPGIRDSGVPGSQTADTPTEYTAEAAFETAFPSLDWSDFSGT